MSQPTNLPSVISPNIPPPPPPKKKKISPQGKQNVYVASQSVPTAIKPRPNCSAPTHGILLPLPGSAPAKRKKQKTKSSWGIQKRKPISTTEKKKKTSQYYDSGGGSVILKSFQVRRNEKPSTGKTPSPPEATKGPEKENQNGEGERIEKEGVELHRIRFKKYREKRELRRNREYREKKKKPEKLHAQTTVNRFHRQHKKKRYRKRTERKKNRTPWYVTHPQYRIHHRKNKKNAISQKLPISQELTAVNPPTLPSS